MLINRYTTRNNPRKGGIGTSKTAFTHTLNTHTRYVHKRLYMKHLPHPVREERGKRRTRKNNNKSCSSGAVCPTDGTAGRFM